MIQVHYIYCALYFHYYYISSTSVHQAVDPGSKWYMPLKLTTWIQRTVFKEGELCVQCPPPLWRLLVYAALITELQQLPYFTTQHIQMKRSFPGGSQWNRICLQCRKRGFWSLGREDPLEWEMATHSSILAWRIPWIDEPGGLQSMGPQKHWTRPSD